jgi:hypothetical protein
MVILKVAGMVCLKKAFMSLGIPETSMGIEAKPGKCDCGNSRMHVTSVTEQTRAYTFAEDSSS